MFSKNRFLEEGFDRIQLVIVFLFPLSMIMMIIIIIVTVSIKVTQNNTERHTLSTVTLNP